MTTDVARTTFTTSRLMDFFSPKELTAQTGHPAAQWPLVIVKELVDNALDACEESGVPPKIGVTVDDAGITVSDNGPGIPAPTVAGVLDYSVRVSSREAYVAPDRGAQGNALKTVVAMPFVLDGAIGRLAVTAGGDRHEIAVEVDPIRQVPVIRHERRAGEVSPGTTITVGWPADSASLLHLARDRFLQIAGDYAWLNPHLDLTLDWHGRRNRFEPTGPHWEKWRPSEPTSPHWYSRDHIERLVAAHLTHPDYTGITVRDFVTRFRGVTGSAKGRAVLAETGMTRTALAELANGRLDSERIGELLDAMKRHARPVEPARLGVIGRNHLALRMETIGCEMDSFTYRKSVGETDGLPWVVEAAFGWCPDIGYRRLITGVNWSPGIGNPFRSMGKYGASLDTLLAEQRVDEDCVVVVHLACPRVSYTDRGKSAVVISATDALGDVITGAIESTTRKWARQRKAEERSATAAVRRREVMTSRRETSIRDAAWAVMPEAYRKASAGGTLPANARQIMYAARPRVLEITGKQHLDDAYFTQNLLPDYIAEHGLHLAWDVVYDARGNFTEPHQGRKSAETPTAALGTLGVRTYQTTPVGDPLELRHLPMDYPTAGPQHRYSSVLFLEKEGFDQLVRQARIADRYDLAIMSTKGMSNVAARALVDYLAGQDVRVLIARDFDPAGFTIAGTLTGDNRRYEFRNPVEAVDLGLRLADVEAYGLDSEQWAGRSAQSKVRDTLRRHGASEDEIAFLVRGGGRHAWGHRVELNALASDQFVTWLESKLDEHGVKKVIPDRTTLEAQYRRALARRAVNSRIDEVMEQVRREATAAHVPADLAARVTEALAENSTLSWDDAVAQIVDEAGGS